MGRMNKKTAKQTQVILVQPSGKDWQPGSSRGHSTSDAYELVLLNQALNDSGITSDYLIQRPLGTNREFYSGTKRITPDAPNLEALTNEIIERNPVVVGIEVMSCYEANARELAKKIKEKSPYVKIVVGGYHPSGYPEILKDSKGCIDFAILGAGERTLVNLTREIIAGRNPFEGRQLRNLPKLGDPTRRFSINESAYAVFNGNDVQLVKRLDSDLIKSFDELGIPKRKMEYQEGSVSGVLARITPDEQVAATMQTRRGCYAGCTYCASSNVYGVKGKKIFSDSNVKSPPNVIKELEYLSGMGINFVFFTDPTFNEDGKHMKEICEGIIKAKNKGTISKEMALYAMFVPFNKEQMERRSLSFDQYSLIKEAGFTRIAFGVESPNDEVLRLMGRNNTISDLEVHLQGVHNSGIFTRGFMMWGHEGETIESLSKYENTMKRLSVDEWRLAPMAPFVGTTTGDAYLVNQAERDFSKYDAIYPVVIPSEIRTHFGSDEETRKYLIEWQKQILKSVYCSREWEDRIQDLYQRFPELREGIDFYRTYLQENLGEAFRGY